MERFHSSPRQFVTVRVILQNFENVSNVESEFEQHIRIVFAKIFNHFSMIVNFVLFIYLFISLFSRLDPMENL